ncbi:MAG TPA: YraN family protein [Desulfobacteraceae bacterium]|nr:YraN family protein [Desulfobacteraceae bacterium]
MTKKELGKKGEEIALRLLRRLGLKCIEKNFRCPLGEIDIIARDKDCLVFLEVRTRRGIETGIIKESIDERKRRKLSSLALYYMKKENIRDLSARFDVVVISMRDKCFDMEYIKDAFNISY